MWRKLQKEGGEKKNQEKNYMAKKSTPKIEG